MYAKEDRQFIGWLELAASPEWQNPIATVHPIDMDECRECFGITIEHRWLCGSDGSLTVFDSIMAATRFLNFLSVERIAKGGRRNWDNCEQDFVQCFRLGAKGITACKKCCAADDAGSQSFAEIAGMEDSWESETARA